MIKLKELHLSCMENNGQDYEESGTIFTEDFVKEIAASNSAQLTKGLMIEFAEWCVDWHNKEIVEWNLDGKKFTIAQLFENFLKEEYGE